MAISSFFLALYAVREYSMPIGWDTPRYLSQTNFVAERGLSGVPETLPPPIKTLASRAGFPVVTLSLSGLFGVSTFKVAATVPVAAAVAIALAAGSLVSSTLRRGAWELAFVALVTGTSAVLIRLVAPETYTDNLLAAALVLAALVPLSFALRDGRGSLAVVGLMVAAGLAHGPTFAVMAGALGLLALAYAPASWRAWRGEGGVSLLRTPTGRLALMVAGAGAAAAAAIYGLLGVGPDTPKLTRGELTKKLREDLPLYRFGLTLPLAAVGGAAVVGQARTSRGEGDERTVRGPAFLLAVLFAWTAILMVAFVLFAAGRNAPVHRSLALLLPLPILMGIGLLAVARLADRALRRLGAAVLIVALAGLSFLGYRTLYLDLARDRGVEWMQPSKIRDAATAVAYLDAAGVPEEEPVVYVIDDTGPNPLSYVPEMVYMMRSVMPPERIENAYAYVGEPGEYLAGRRTFRDTPKTYNANVARFWPAVERLLPQRPVALLLSSYNADFGEVAAEHPEWIVAPNVIALEGPRPAADVPVPPIPYGPRTIVQGGLLGAGTLLVLGLIGLGWAAFVLPGRVRSFEVLALAPAFGIGALIFAGVLLDAAGLRLGGVGGTVTVLIAAVPGWVAGFLRLRREPEAIFSPA